jgi:hypothetical protein
MEGEPIFFSAAQARRAIEQQVNATTVVEDGILDGTPDSPPSAATDTPDDHARLRWSTVFVQKT